MVLGAMARAPTRYTPSSESFHQGIRRHGAAATQDSRRRRLVVLSQRADRPRERADGLALGPRDWRALYSSESGVHWPSPLSTHSQCTHTHHPPETRAGGPRNIEATHHHRPSVPFTAHGPSRSATHSPRAPIRNLFCNRPYIIIYSSLLPLCFALLCFARPIVMLPHMSPNR